MDKLVTIRLELTCKDAFGKLYTTRDIDDIDKDSE